MGDWEPPKENSLEALNHGMSFADGVEFDLRMDSDGELVIYHDEFVPGKGKLTERLIELLGTDELRKEGIVTLEDLFGNSDFSSNWQSGGKTVDIEIKEPHPKTKIRSVDHFASMMSKLDMMVEDLDVPDKSVIVSSFSPKIIPVAKSSGFKVPVTRLMPHIRSWGRFWRVKRAVAMPHFARTSVPKIANHLRNNQVPVMGMALEYIYGWPRWIGPSLPVGIQGRGLERFSKIRRGMGAFVWPAPLKAEKLLLGAGVSLISDHMDPTVKVRPDGSPRWPRPASQPLDAEWTERLNSASPDEIGDTLNEAESSLPSWGEIEEERRFDIVVEQGKRFLWAGKEEDWKTDSRNGIPWGSPRIIGHRGAGGTHSS